MCSAPRRQNFVWLRQDGLWDSLLVLLHSLFAWFRIALWPVDWAPTPVGQVAALTVYPVKGCRGVSLSKARIKSTGVYWDRHWMIVSATKAKWIYQAQVQRLALIEVDLPAEAFLGELPVPAIAVLELRAPGKQPLQVPLDTDPEMLAKRSLVDCEIWDWRGKAYDEGDTAADWLSDYTGRPVRLMRYAGGEHGYVRGASSDPKRRLSDARFAKGYENAFADRFPFLLTNEASLEDLNSRLETPVPMNRFRPNITVAGAPAWQEDTWTSFHIVNQTGPVRFFSAQPCDRCKVTTTSQETAERDDVGRQPLATLETFRSLKLLGWSGPDFHSKSAFFGWLIAPNDSGVIAVGDRVLVSRRRTAPYKA